MKYIIILILAFASSTIQAQQLSTTFHDDYSRWKFEGENFNTVFHDGFDRWSYDGLTIQTTLMNDWNNWKVGSNVKLRTVFNNSLDKWTIKGQGYNISVQTTFHGEYALWSITGDLDGSFRIVFIDDWKRWEFDLDLEEIPKEIRAAILLIAIQTSVKKH
ncbi:MAG: hypothetical protein QNK23_12550 [Crocinitomicaceae bacterium]|nr:hypothetical protein [Crocinitomicaceae bacterium]